MNVDVKLDVSSWDDKKIGAAVYKSAVNTKEVDDELLRIANEKAMQVNAALSNATNGSLRSPYFAHVKTGVPGAIKVASISLPKRQFRGKQGIASLAMKTGALRW